MGKQIDSFIFKSISYNVILQIGFRAFSFVLNAVLFRNASTELIGVCNFRLALLYSTVMFLSREPFRRALPSLGDKLASRATLTRFVNSLWLVVPSGLFIATLVGFVWTSEWLERPNELLVPHYDMAVFVCCVACVVELCGEPSNCLTQLLLLAKLKVLIEATSLLIFNITFVILAIYWPSLGVLAYSIPRLLSALIVVVANNYYLLGKKLAADEESEEHSRRVRFDERINVSLLLPRSQVNGVLDAAYLKLVSAYYWQSVLKQILTEGEKYLITAFSLLTLADSALYDLVNNLGSLIARFVFLPVEDASYVFFTKSLARGTKYAQQQQQQQQQQQANSTAASGGGGMSPKTYLELFLKAMSLIGLLVLTFGQSYSSLLLFIYGGTELSHNVMCVDLLRLNCGYIFLLSLNGLTESFFNATMSDAQLKRHNYRLVAFSLVFLSLALVLGKLYHAYGFMVANCANMAVRIAYSCWYISDFFRGYKHGSSSESSSASSPEHARYDVLWCIVPDYAVGVCLAVALLVGKWSESTLMESGKPLHLLVGGVLFLATLLVCAKRETQLRQHVVRFVKAKLL